MPTDLPTFIRSGFLWLLPDPPRPAQYAFIEGLGSDSDPLWQQVSFVFDPEYSALGFFNLPEGQTLENPAGLAPQMSAQVTPGLSRRQLDYEAAHPLPGDWEAYVTSPKTSPAQRMEALRRRSTVPVEGLAIHIFDTFDTLLDRFTNTTGRLPANFEDLLQGNWVVTGPFRALQANASTDPDPAARLTLYFEPSSKSFVWQLDIFTRQGLQISEQRALKIDTDTDGPRRSPLLLIIDPAAIDLANATTLTALAFPRTATGLPEAQETIEDQATAQTTAAPAEAGAATD